MANKSGNAFALTAFCPIRSGRAESPPAGLEGQTHSACLRNQLQSLRVSVDSPMSRVPNTYLSRFFLISDVLFEGKPAILEHLQSEYLVFAAEFHGELIPYLQGMFRAIEPEIKFLLQHCYGFDPKCTLDGFVAYALKCQVETTFFFNGSNDLPVDVQLKSLYLKQEFSKFVYANQGRKPADLQQAFLHFISRTQPEVTAGPTWTAGAYTLENAAKGANIPQGPKQ